MALTVKGSGVIMNTTVGSVDLAAGTAPGDLIIVGTYTLSPTMTDARMVEAVASPDGAGRIWHGVDDGTGDTLALAATASPNNCIVWVVLDKKHRVSGGGTSVTSGAIPATVPALAASGVVAVAVGGHSVVAGDKQLTEPPWTQLVSSFSSLAAGAIYGWAGAPPSPAETWMQAATAVADRTCTAAFVVSFGTVAPPARLFPRADGLGVGGGRHFPPPKSQQSSGRRFGYY